MEETKFQQQCAKIKRLLLAFDLSILASIFSLADELMIAKRNYERETGTGHGKANPQKTVPFVEAIGTQIGKSPSTVRTYLSIARLSDSARRAIEATRDPRWTKTALALVGRGRSHERQLQLIEAYRQGGIKKLKEVGGVATKDAKAVPREPQQPDVHRAALAVVPPTDVVPAAEPGVSDALSEAAAEFDPDVLESANAFRRHVLQFSRLYIGHACSGVAVSPTSDRQLIEEFEAGVGRLLADFFTGIRVLRQQSPKDDELAFNDDDDAAQVLGPRLTKLRIRKNLDRAYKMRAAPLHPDRNSDPAALREYREVNRAYEQLRGRCIR